MHYRSHLTCRRPQRSMERFTNTKPADMHMIYGLVEENSQVAEKLYRERNPQREAPDFQIFANLCDIGVLEMVPVAQTQFAPLSEALCKVVADLNGESIQAATSTIKVKLEENFPEMQVPCEEILYKTLGGLIKERKLYHTGNVKWLRSGMKFFLTGWLLHQHREIGSRVGRNQTTVMQICDRWMQEGTTDRRGRSHSPQCTASLSARTIRHGLQLSDLSARRPLLGLHLTQSHRRLRRQWCDERRMWVAEWNEVVCTEESCICLQHHDGRIRVWRHHGKRMLNSCIIHRHSGPAPGIMVWGGIGYHYLTPLVRIAGTLNSRTLHFRGVGEVVLPYLQGLVTSTFQQDNARPHEARIVQRFFVNHQIELLP
ncbi:storkhead-box protein 1 [Trichonephila clavipes]|nr:storkhead-box protein 1 [Trichonephila clavipes]